jgi:Ca2+-binding RTX toxin-like protein
VENETPFTRGILDVAHAGDPVIGTRPLAAVLTQHGRFTSIDLPTVQDAGSLAELARQEQDQESDPSIVTEHDMARYLSSVRALAASPLSDDAADDAAAIILDASDDVYALERGDGLLLGLAGDDGLVGSAARDLIDAGAGDDRVDAAAGDDVLAGGPGDDALAGGAGLDTASFAAPSSQVDVRTYLGVSYAIPLDAGGLDGVDRLEGVERLVFADGVAVQPADNFDALGYIASHADLADAFGTDGAAGLRHFAHFGLREGRGITFDGWQYLASFGDLIAAFGPDRDAASAHYISRGRLEGRSPDDFDARRYLDNYADLRAAFGGDEGAATTHFVTHGYGEGRTDEPIPVVAAAAEGTSDFLL